MAVAQNETPVYAANTTAEKRAVTHRNIINNSILKNLSLPLTTENEESWEDAFYSMALLNYRTLWLDNRIRLSFDSIGSRSPEFQRSLLEMISTVYPSAFKKEVLQMAENISTDNAKVFAMCAEYVYRKDSSAEVVLNALNNIHRYALFYDTEKGATILQMLYQSLSKPSFSNTAKIIKTITAKTYLPGNTIVYSFQRHNRNYPGIVMVRKPDGSFVTGTGGNIFYTQQLARSVSNLPFYLTNGNTPQGIFRMNGFDISKSLAIGPTTNIQLMMPFETTPQFFLKDPSITDTIWNESLYKKLLPAAFADEPALLQTYFASRIGRTEIIAHGTTVDPEYYRNQPYYPHTPTQGCLCTREIWDATGKRSVSDQQALADAVKKTGSADGYLIVIELDDRPQPVSIEEILPFLIIN